MGGNDSLSKNRVLMNFAKKAPKLHLALALTLGICMRNYSSLALADSAEWVEIPGKVDFSHSFQWQKSSLRKSL